jgi:hypothetical protein
VDEDAREFAGFGHKLGIERDPPFAQKAPCVHDAARVR